MEFEGTLETTQAGEYTFRLGSDDGSRLWVNGAQVVDNDGLHAMEVVAGTVTLEPGDAAVRVQYFDGGGEQGLALRVSGPGMDNLLLSKDAPALAAGGGAFMSQVTAELPEWAQAILRNMREISAGEAMMHLWFLNYLIWLVAGFAVVASLVGRLGIKRWPAWIIASRWRWLWLVPITSILQLLMSDFGPDTTTGLVPWFPLLLYYALFFGYGALCYGHPEFEANVGRHWHWCLALAVPALILGICWLHTRNSAVAMGYADHRTKILLSHFLTCLFQVIFVWLMISGSIGFFRRFFAAESKPMRFVSDSSYWLYIAHLPLLILIKPLLDPLNLPGLVEFILSGALATGILLVLYQSHVRYTFVGTLLNGKRMRGDVQTSSRKRLPALLLCIFTWVAGIHRLYAGRYLSAVLQVLVLGSAVTLLVTGGPPVLVLVILGMALWAFLDFISIISGSFVDGQGSSIREWS